MGYVLLFAFLCFVAYVLIAIIVRDLASSRRQKKLDEIAHDVLAEFDFNKEKEGIKSIGGRFVSKEHRCPRCNGMLVMRSGIYGNFWGCNRYPECKYTRNIKS